MPDTDAVQGRPRHLRRPFQQASRGYRPSRLRLDGFRGSWECELIAWTPLEAGGVADVLNGSLESRVGGMKRKRGQGGKEEEFKPFHVDPVTIPGTGLKGMVRAVAEFVGAGCYRVADTREVGRIPREWEPCKSRRGVCTCCDMFGAIGGDLPGLRGKVRIGDGRLVGQGVDWRLPEFKENRWAPHHHLEGPRDAIQVFFPHLPWNGNRRRDGKGNAEFFPVKVGARFRFTVTFEGLDAEQLALLDWCLFLQPGLLHKLGKGKAIGLGSVGIRCLEQHLEKLPDRLQGETGTEVHWKGDEGEKFLLDHAKERLATPWLAEVLAARNEIETREDLRELREVMQWPAARPGEPLEIPGAGVPEKPRSQEAKEFWIRGARATYRPQVGEIEVEHQGKRYSARGDLVKQFKERLSKNQLKKIKGGALVVDARVREERNLRKVLEIRLPGPAS